VAAVGARARLPAVTLPPQLRPGFPNGEAAVKTSDSTYGYNCHAWGADDPSAWWEPTRVLSSVFPSWVRLYWPEGLPLFDYSLTNFVRAFETEGFVPCPDGAPEAGFEKLALYSADGESITHTARELPSGAWTSKLGPSIDVLHPDVGALEGPSYGRVIAYMRRPRRARNVREAP
jgi:hypothetical protein